MGSRFDFDPDGDAMPIHLWRANLRRALRGKRGQAVLAEMESALLALPHQRLITGEVADHCGDVCAIGALGLHRLMRDGKSFLEAEEELPYLADNDMETMEYGQSLGLTGTLAWHIAYLNDERFADATPEERYRKMLDWVREHLGPEVRT